MLVLAAVAGLASARALADSNPPAPTDTTLTSPPPPSTTVTVPQSTVPAPAPDPAPSPKPKPKPKPVHPPSRAHHSTPRPAPVMRSVPQPPPAPAPRPLVNTAPTPTKKIVHVRTRHRRVHTNKRTHVVATKQAPPTPPKHQASAHPGTNTPLVPAASNPRPGGSTNSIAILIVVALVVLLCSVLAVVGTRRALAERADSADNEHETLSDDSGTEASSASLPVRTVLPDEAVGPELLSPLAPAAASQNGQVAESGWWETCEIIWWRGYRKSDFYALAISPDGEPYDVARSRDFSWRRTEPPPPADAIVAAREELLQKLVNDGWEKHAPGESWYAGRYKRWNSGEPRDKLEQEAAPTLVPANGQAGKSYASQI